MCLFDNYIESNENVIVHELKLHKSAGPLHTMFQIWLDEDEACADCLDDEPLSFTINETDFWKQTFKAFGLKRYNDICCFGGGQHYKELYFDNASLIVKFTYDDEYMYCSIVGDNVSSLID